MKMVRNLRGTWIVFAMVWVWAGFCIPIRAQNPATQNPGSPGQTETQAPARINQLPNFALLNLSPEQIQKIRAINEELRDQRQTAAQRLRLTQRALTEAIESTTANEALIEQRSREVAEAQATTIRLRSLTEVRILQVLTAEQRAKLKEMRQNQAMRRAGNRQLPVNVLRRRQQALQGNVNAQRGLGPGQRRVIRRPQKP